MNSEPLFRILCHCTICQHYNNAPFADVLVFRANDVTLPPVDSVDYRTYKPPPNVKRGRCASCEQAAVEVFDTPLMPKLVMVPRPMFGEDADLPTPSAHIFYNERVADADDAYPKHEGFFRSEFAFLKQLLSAR